VHFICFLNNVYHRLLTAFT